MVVGLSSSHKELLRILGWGTWLSSWDKWRVVKERYTRVWWFLGSLILEYERSANSQNSKVLCGTYEIQPMRVFILEGMSTAG